MVKNQASLLAGAMTTPPSNTSPQASSKTAELSSKADAGKYVQPPAPTHPPPPPPQQPPTLPPSNVQSKLPKILAPQYPGQTTATPTAPVASNPVTTKSAIPTPTLTSSNNPSGPAPTQTLIVKPIRAPAPKTTITSIPPLPNIVKTTAIPTPIVLQGPLAQSNQNTILSNSAQANKPPSGAAATASNDPSKSIRNSKPPTTTKVMRMRMIFFIVLCLIKGLSGMNPASWIARDDYLYISRILPLA